MRNPSMFNTNIFSYFILIIMLNNLFLKRVTKKCKYCLYIYFFFIGTISGLLWNKISFILILSGSLLILLSFTSQYNYWNIILFLTVYLCFVISDYIVTLPFIFIGYDFFSIITSDWIPFFLIISTDLIGIIPTYFIGKWLHKKLFFHLNLIPKGFRYQLMSEILVCVCIFLFNIIMSNRSAFPTDIMIFNVFLFLAFIFTNIFLFINLFQTLQENQLLALRKQAQKELTEYTTQLEAQNLQIRRFRHDYLNLLNTMNGYIQNGDMELLKEYFEQKILPESRNLVNKEAIIARLSNIKIFELKGILYGKLVQAMNLDLEIMLELTDEISHIDMNLLILSRVLGIYLDNAIEAATKTDEKVLLVAILCKNEYIIFHIENSTQSINFPIEQLIYEGFTTKKGHQGLGLSYVKDILDTCSNVQTSTQYKNGRFVQLIIIENGKSASRKR